MKFKTSLEGLLFKAAKSLSQRDFRNVMARIRALHRDAGAYIDRIKPERWARAFFPVRRFGHVTSNIAESANAWLDHVRYLDPVGVFSLYILKLNCLFEKRRVKYASLPPDGLPLKVAKRLDKSIETGRTLALRRHTTTLFEVQAAASSVNWRVVDLEAKTCSCGFYREHGIPCSHVCAALLSLNIDNFTPYISPERLRDALASTYVGTIKPIDESLEQ